MMFKTMAMTLVAVGGWLVAATPAQAHVSFSFGFAAPVYAPPPVYYQPPPVYDEPPPVYYRRRPAYDGPPAVVYVPAPRYNEAPIVYGPAPRDDGPRWGWDRGYARERDEHRRWHEEHRERSRRDDDERD